MGPELTEEAKDVTLIGWNNHIPDKMRIAEGATVYPNITVE